MAQPQPVTPGKKRSILTGLGLAMLSICAALALLEVGVRFLPPPYEAGTGKFFSCDDRLGWTGAPNFEGTFEYGPIQQPLSFNSRGMHDTEHSPEKGPGTFRILLLGDSFVQALQVGERETAHQRLEDELNAGGVPGAARVEVISGGVVNWGTNQQLIYYREEGRSFEPDLVLLMFYLGNDLQDNLPGNALTIGGTNCYAPYFAQCQGRLLPAPLRYAPGLSRLQAHCSPLQRGLIDALGRLYRQSRLYQQLEPLITANRPRQSFGRAYPSPFSALYLPAEEAELQQAWQLSRALIAQLKQEIEADGARLAVALISPEIVLRLARLSPAEQAVFLHDNPAFAGADLNRPNARLAGFLAGEGIPYLDLTAPMVEHLAGTETPLYIVGEGHWTVEGNRVAAEILARWVREIY